MSKLKIWENFRNFTSINTSNTLRLKSPVHYLKLDNSKFFSFNSNLNPRLTLKSNRCTSLKLNPLKSNKNTKSKTFTKCFLFGNGVKTFLDATNNQPRVFSEERLTEEIQSACHKNVEALVELMHTLNVCMLEINKEYKNCVEQQILLTTQCTKMGPLGEHWDELTKYRVQADELKMEFNKYELLIQKIGQMVFYQAVTSLMSGNEKELDLLNFEFSRLEKLMRDIVQQHKDLDLKLVVANRESILYGTTSPDT